MLRTKKKILGERLTVRRREPRPAPLRPEQLMVIGDYHRARQGFPSDTELARALGVHRSRVAAWKNGVLPDYENGRRLAELAFVVQDLMRFLHPVTVHAWLCAPKSEADHLTPIELLRQGDLVEVLLIANATEHGAFT